jgi:hypothetical protein
MALTLDKLRELTTQAHATAEAARSVADQHAKDKAARLARRHRFLADQIIERLELRAEKAALKESRQCQVMRLRSARDFSYSQPVTPATLTGVARLVWDDLDKNKLPLILLEWDDGVGMRSGWDIYLQW